MKNWDVYHPIPVAAKDGGGEALQHSSGCLRARSRPAAFGSCTMAVCRMRPEIVKTISRRRGYIQFSRSRYSSNPRQK